MQLNESAVQLREQPLTNRTFSNLDQLAAERLSMMETFALFLFLASSSMARSTLPRSERTDMPRSQLTARVLRSRLLECQEKIKSLQVSYHSEYYSDPAAPAKTYLYRVVAAKSPCFVYHLNAHPCAEFDWNDDPFLQISYIRDTQAETTFPFTNAYFVTHLDANAPLPGTLSWEFYFQATGIWPVRKRRAPRWGDERIPVALRDVAQCNHYSVVRSAQDRVNGRSCHVLTWPEHDYLWIDVQHGCALLARESFLPSNKAKIHRFELSEHREVGPGIWLPTRLRNIQYDYNAPTDELRGRKVVDGRFAVDTMKVNSVADALFTFIPLPGALLTYDGKAPKRKYPVQVATGGLSVLDRLADWVQCGVQQDHSTPLLASPYSLYAGLVVVPVILVLEVTRRLKRRAQ